MITKTQAKQLIDLRQKQARGGVVLQAPLFIRHAVSLGLLPKSCSTVTLWRLFSGRMYPDLQDSSGRPYNYSAMPRASRGPKNPLTAGLKLSLLQRVEALERRLAQKVRGTARKKK